MVKLGYLGVLVLGFLYVYAFTAGIATLTLLDIAEEFDLISEGAIAGIGAFLGDLLLSYLMRGWLDDELSRLAGSYISRRIEGKLPTPIRDERFTLLLACVLIASPLPTEVGAVLLASVRRVPTSAMILIMGSLHTIGIFSILILEVLRT